MPPESFRRRLFGLQDRREVVGDVDADFGQRRVVVGTEGAQGFGAAFGGAVGAEKPVLEIERHFGDLGPVADARSGDFDGRDEVLAPVGAQHADRDLAPGENHRFAEVFEHETQRRGRVGHGVGAVQDYEAVVVGIAFDDDIANAHPVARAHIGAVDVHGLHDVELAEARDLGDALGELLTGQGGGEAVAVLGRCDGAARGDEKDALHAGIPIVFAAAEAESFGSIVAQGVQCSNVLHHL